MATTVAQTFEALRKALNKPFLQDSAGIAWQATLGRLQDEAFNRVVQAKVQRFPTDCAVGGLQYIASERELERVINEPENDYREILRTAWAIWAQAGTAVGDAKSFDRMNVASVTIKRRADFSGVAPDPYPYVTAFARDVWAQFDVILEGMPWRLRLWGTSPPWGTGLWGTTMTQAQQDQIIRLLRTFRAGHDTPTYVWMHFGAGHLWGIAGPWGHGVWGGSGPTIRLLVGEQHWKQRGLIP